jgi:hypothetical protein
LANPTELVNIAKMTIAEGFIMFSLIRSIAEYRPNISFWLQIYAV